MQMHLFCRNTFIFTQTNKTSPQPNQARYLYYFLFKLYYIIFAKQSSTNIDDSTHFTHYPRPHHPIFRDGSRRSLRILYPWANEAEPQARTFSICGWRHGSSIRLEFAPPSHKRQRTFGEIIICTRRSGVLGRYFISIHFG